MRQPARPRKNGSNRIGRSLFALLVLAVVPGDSTVRGLGFHCVAVRRHQNRGHQPKRAEALRHRVRLHVAVIVLAGPDIAARPFQRGCDHVVDQPVFVPDLGFLELVLEFRLIDLLEKVLEAAVIGFQNRVLRGEIAGHLALQRIVH